MLLEHAAGEYIGLCAHGECTVEGAALDLGAAYGNGDGFFEGAAVDGEIAARDVHLTLRGAAVNDEFASHADAQRVCRLTR